MNFEADSDPNTPRGEHRESGMADSGDMPFPPYDPRRAAQVSVIAATMAKLELKQTKLAILEFLADSNTYEDKEVRRQDILRAVTEPHHMHTSGVPHSSSNSNIPKIPSGAHLPRGGPSKAPLLPRDLRNVDPAFAYTREPCLLVRRHAILIHMDPVEAIILHDRCFIFKKSQHHGSLSLNHGEKFSPARGSRTLSATAVSDLEGDRNSVSDEKAIRFFVDRLQEQSASGIGAGLGVMPASGIASESGLPFEFTAVEAALVTVCRKLERESTLLLNKVRYHLSKVSHITSSKRLDTLRRLKIDLTAVELNIVALRKALTDVLESDEDMAYMQLTKLHATPNLFADSDFSDHEDVELLLESYLMEFDSSLTKVRLLLQEIQHTEDLITLLLDAKRNQLMRLDIWISVSTVAIGIGTLITGIFGMNLQNTHEDSYTAFVVVTCLLIVLMLLVFVLFTFYLRRMRRVHR